MRAKLPVIEASARRAAVPYRDLEPGLEPVWGEENDLLAVTGQQYDEPAGEFTKLRESWCSSGCSLDGRHARQQRASVMSGSGRCGWPAPICSAPTGWTPMWWAAPGPASRPRRSSLRRVRFVDCRFDTVNFRGFEADVDVEFVDCELIDLDLAFSARSRTSPLPAADSLALHLGGGDAEPASTCRGRRVVRSPTASRTCPGLTISTAQAEGLAVALAHSGGSHEFADADRLDSACPGQSMAGVTGQNARMIRMRCDFFAESLSLSTSMTVLLPQKTLHQVGMTGASSDEAAAGALPVARHLRRRHRVGPPDRDRALRVAARLGGGDAAGASEFLRRRALRRALLDLLVGRVAGLGPEVVPGVRPAGGHVRRRSFDGRLRRDETGLSAA